ncbi:hypothetical protein [Nitrososphaera sp.]|uniref:hypothetical protein n=1 Tax=Nitrososphaera sp. TaxID=1971748 RepID=UPI0017EC0C79|nr:hypothetical protein [Nitrososphaera sp.]NWG37679.1 hypothetical protein [Nitrososphaera sp.]
MNFNKVQKRRGIGTVITTLIVLIASVVLGAGVIFFGGSLFQTNTQAEAIEMSNVHSWVNPAGAVGETATTAFVVQNTGSKAVTITSISLRGVSVPTTDWYYFKNIQIDDIQRELSADYTEANVDVDDDVVGDEVMLGGTISLNQGEAAIVYLNQAGNITPIDSGKFFTLQIKAGQATAVQTVSVVNQ